MLGSLLWIDGRNSRLKWWTVSFAPAFLIILFSVLLFAKSPEQIQALKDGSGFELGKFIAAMLVFFALVMVSGWIGIINDIRRLHDLDKSGWWSLVYAAPAIVLVFLFKVFGKDIGSSSAPLGLLFFLLFAASVWRWAELGFFAGSAGDNDFGPPSGLSGTIDLDEEIEKLQIASGRSVPSSGHSTNAPAATSHTAPSAAPVRPSFGVAAAGGGSFGRRR